MARAPLGLLIPLGLLLLGCEPEATGGVKTLPKKAPPSVTAKAGKMVFLHKALPRCGTCHTLSDAGTFSKVGPNLDEIKPDYQRVLKAVTFGVKTETTAMPAQKGTLTKQQIHAVATYVSEITQ